MQSEPTDLDFFVRDETPDSEEAWLSQLCYLHINGRLIFKRFDYTFSEGCWAEQGGMVRKVWTPLNKYVAGTMVFGKAARLVLGDIEVCELEGIMNPGESQQFKDAFVD